MLHLKCRTTRRTCRRNVDMGCGSSKETSVVDRDTNGAGGATGGRVGFCMLLFFEGSLQVNPLFPRNKAAVTL